MVNAANPAPVFFPPDHTIAGNLQKSMSESFLVPMGRMAHLALVNPNPMVSIHYCIFENERYQTVEEGVLDPTGFACMSIPSSRCDLTYTIAYSCNGPDPEGCRPCPYWSMLVDQAKSPYPI